MKKESGVLCTLSHWEHSQPLRPGVTGSFEVAMAVTDRALDGMSPLGFLLPASSLGSVRVRGSCPHPDAPLHVMLHLVLHANAALHSDLFISVPSVAPLCWLFVPVANTHWPGRSC